MSDPRPGTAIILREGQMTRKLHTFHYHLLDTFSRFFCEVLGLIKYIQSLGDILCSLSKKSTLGGGELLIPAYQNWNAF